jgi:hypothetical protein
MNRNDALILALSGSISIEEVPTISTSKNEIHITPADLLPTLHLFINGKLTEQQLQRWSSWVLNQEEFCVKNWEIDSVADHYEPMWYGLQKLSTPFIDGKIIKESVEAYIQKLQAL